MSLNRTLHARIHIYWTRVRSPTIIKKALDIYVEWDLQSYMDDVVYLCTGCFTLWLVSNSWNCTYWTTNTFQFAVAQNVTFFYETHLPISTFVLTHCTPEHRPCSTIASLWRFLYTQRSFYSPPKTWDSLSGIVPHTVLCHVQRVQGEEGCLSMFNSNTISDRNRLLIPLTERYQDKVTRFYDEHEDFSRFIACPCKSK